MDGGDTPRDVDGEERVLQALDTPQRRRMEERAAHDAAAHCLHQSAVAVGDSERRSTVDERLDRPQHARHLSMSIAAFGPAARKLISPGHGRGPRR